MIKKHNILRYMVREISVEDISQLNVLIERYVSHKKEDGVTSDTVKKQMQSGLEKGNLVLLVDDNSKGAAQGFLVINLKSDRLPILFANWNFESERRLLDYAFKKISPTCSHISFESGYPKPWLSDELSIYATTLGFVKHDRAFMQLHPVDREVLINCAKSEELEFVPFDEPMVEEIAKLVFKCVDGTIDQDLFPYVYGSIQKIEDFLLEFLEGTYGIHELFYSWVLIENKQNIGACFLMRNDETVGLMHIVVDPDFQQRGFGKALLCHSLNSLLRICPSVDKITLAVTLSNHSAKRMYDSLGFRTLNDSSTFVWKRKIEE